MDVTLHDTPRNQPQPAMSPPRPPLGLEEPILIVGAGTFGLSTALHLLRRGHTHITLLDPYPPPSAISAGNDINKIVTTSASSDPFLTRLSVAALTAWRTDVLLKPFLHDVGIVLCGCSPPVLDEVHDLAQNYAHTHPDAPPVKLVGREGDGGVGRPFAEAIPALKDGPMTGWEGYWLPQNNGWVEARNACIAIAEECRRLGVNFIEDRAANLIFERDGACAGVETTGGSEIRAARIVLCAGASSVELLDFHRQLMAKCWTLAHIAVSNDDNEAAAGLKGHPLLLNLEKGFLFEPDARGEVKICNEFPGYTHCDASGLSHPLKREQIPLEAERAIRALLAETIPVWQRKDFVWARLCWCVDTPDRRFILCEHPDHRGLVLGTGDSGLAFKFLPIVGGWIADVVEKGDVGLPEEERGNWRWRPETGGDWDDAGGRWGGSGKIKDLSEVDEWTHIPRRSM